MHERACEAVGIDLGTTYSSLAYVDTQGIPRMVPDTSGYPVVPSAIFFDDSGEIIVGDFALEQAKLAAERVVQFVKVHMGEEWRQEYQSHLHTPESLSAIILRHLVQEAEPQIGPIPKAVITVPAYFTEKRRRATQQAGEIAGLEVIGTLNEPMAATLAYGLHRQDTEQKVVVYDLGGGTFDVTVVRIAPGEIEELATQGNRELGGRDWDQCLINYVAEDFLSAHGLDPRQQPQSAQDLLLECERAKRRLGRMAKTSIRLHAGGYDHVTEVTRDQFESLTASLVQSTKLTVEMALEDAGLDWPDIAKVVLVGGSTKMPAVRRMLQEAAGFPPDTGINPVAAVALGAALYAYMLEADQAPATAVSHSVQEPSQEEPSPAEPQPVRPPETDDSELTRLYDGATDTDWAVEEPPPPQHQAEATPEPPAAESEGAESDEAAVSDSPHGKPPMASAAFHEAGVRAEEQRPQTAELPTVRFVTAHGIGVKVRAGDGWKNSVLIARNTPVPCSATKQYRTAAQTTSDTYIKVEVTQGDEPNIDLAELLGTGRIEGFPWNEPPGQPVDVTMAFDEQGRLNITAVYLNTGQQMELTLDVAGGLKPAEVQQHKDYLQQTGFLKVFDPDTALSGLEIEDDEDGFPELGQSSDNLD